MQHAPLKRHADQQGSARALPAGWRGFILYLQDLLLMRKASIDQKPSATQNQETTQKQS